MTNDAFMKIKHNHPNRSFPLLFLPYVRERGWSVKDTLFDAGKQSEVMDFFASAFPTLAVMNMMDLSIEAEAFGADIKYFDDDVPSVRMPLIEHEKDVLSLKVPTVGSQRTSVVVKAIQLAKKKIDEKPVIANVIGPFTLLCRLYGMTHALSDCMLRPHIITILMEKISDFLVKYIDELLLAGADGIIMSEPAAGLLSPRLFRKHSIRHVNEIQKRIIQKDWLLIYHNCAEIMPLIDIYEEIHADAFHFGNAVKMADVIKAIPVNKIMMGNVDPDAFDRRHDADKVSRETSLLLSDCDRYDHFIASTGCDVPLNASLSNIEAYFSAVKTFHE